MDFSKAAPIMVLSLVCCVLSATSLQPSLRTGVQVVGEGAYPLSFTDASAWFTHEKNDTSHVLIALFYFQGSPGWLSGKKTDFKWQIAQNPATIDMTVGTAPIHLKYWQDTDEVEVLGKRYKRSTDNVFLVSQINSPAPIISALGTHDLNFTADDIPSIALLRREPDVWASVTGRPRSDHPLAQLTASDQIRAWDTEGLRLLKSGEPEQERKGCELFRRAAEKGYASAQYRLGYCYESGKGVEQNFATANQWYTKAGIQGHVDAQYKLGHSYRTGRGSPIDLPTALSWYKKASALGDREASNNVGWMYATGQGTRVDQDEAYRWFLKSAQQGEPGAQLEVAKRLSEGNGVHKDLTLAYSWLIVLDAQESSFTPDDWKQLQKSMASVGEQLDIAAKKRADEDALAWMTIIAKADMERLSHQ